MGLLNSYQNWKVRRKLRRQGAVRTGKKHTEESEFLQKLNHSRTLGVFIMVCLWGVTALLLSLPLHDDGEIYLNVGSLIQRTVIADFDFEFVDKEQTENLLRDASEKAPVYYSVRENLTHEIKNRFEQLFQAAEARDAAQTEKKEYVAEPGPSGEIAQVSNLVLDGLNALNRNTQAKQEFERTLDALLNAGIFSEKEKFSSKLGQKVRIINTLGHERAPEPITGLPDVNAAAKKLANAMLRFYPNGPNRAELATGFLPLCLYAIGTSGNLVRNAPRTKEAKEIAQKQVKPVVIKVSQRTPVLHAETRASQLDLDRYHAYLQEKAQQERTRFNAAQVVQNTVWSFLMALFVGFYIWHLHPEIASSNRKILLFSSIIFFSLLLIYLTAYRFTSLRSLFQLPMDLMPHLLPLAVASVLLSSTMGFRAALFGGFMVSGFSSILLNQQMDYALEEMFICAICALAVRGAMDYRKFFLRTFFTVFIMNCLLEVNLLEHAEGNIKESLWALSASLLGALLTAMGSLLLVFFYEIFFHVDTNMSLMVLCNYSHSLLERMKREATGTFFHSLMVATLAEDAARAIGANPLKTKVGAMYHDIGKLSKPQYFTENNLDLDNRHIDLNPQVSSIIIRDHIKEGLDLARKEKMSRVIRDAIEQHHGTDLVHYFYRRALEENRNTGTPVTEVQYRYHGVPPKNKEMAIISLADACEAACRSLEKPNASRVEALVDEIFRKRFRDGQLAQSDLTMAELQKVRNSFVNDLVSMRHGRIAYQKESDNNDENDLFMAHGKTPEARSGNSEKAD